ncbi:hypothetical protein RRG08_067316 [Elysia crispata]|uniref:Uncharacterized protein n=1 Tax=Elysia crispata TaxID=231223 RepID=A0AAE1AIT4_9GAST|nr:hypothetical protein RRG08_067316 [Elysia crispata]
MKLLSALALLVCLGNTLAIKCPNGRDFSAVTFDAVNFVPGVSYHDIANGIALYENQLDSGVQLMVVGTAHAYVKSADGSCVKYVDATEDIETSEFLSYTDRAGVARSGVLQTHRELAVRFLVNDESCFTEFTHATYAGKLKWAYFFNDQKDLTAAEKKHIEDVHKEFQAADCPTQSLS